MDARPRIRASLVTAALAAALVAACPAAASQPRAGVVVGMQAHSRASEGPGRRIAPGVSLVPAGAATAARLRRARGVRYAEPNRSFHAAAAPSDRLFARQWPLSQPDGIGAVSAWWSSVGAGATVAVLDSG